MTGSIPVQVHSTLPLFLVHVSNFQKTTKIFRTPHQSVPDNVGALWVDPGPMQSCQSFLKLGFLLDLGCSSIGTGSIEVFHIVYKPSEVQLLNCILQLNAHTRLCRFFVEIKRCTHQKWSATYHGVLISVRATKHGATVYL